MSEHHHTPTIQYFERTVPGAASPSKLAYVYTPPEQEGQDKPLIMFLGGYRSDMGGTKATYFEQACIKRGQGYLRFDYSGHGDSDGAFEDGTIGSWAADARAVLDHIAPKDVILVGSSMGGWIAFLVAYERPARISGLIGIAAAPDFTEEIYHERLNDAQRKTLIEKGMVNVENDYSDEPYKFTKSFFKDGKNNLILNTNRTAQYPIHLIQGKQDKDVPWQTADKIAKAFESSDVKITYIDDGDHRLSAPHELILIDQEIQALSGY